MPEDKGITAADVPVSARPEAARLRDLSGDQWRSGIAAWLGWMFDGLDLHLYTLVALPFVAQLLGTVQQDPRVGYYGSWIQAAFLVGWALGGGFFGRVGDRIGRTQALALTILTYALFTGLAFFAQAWWQLLIFRFLAALGIGGEWAVGASLLSETWPARWRPWIAAVLQSAVNVGVLGACAAFYLLTLVAAPERCVFLVGVLPALMVFWIRRAVPESQEWHAAKLRQVERPPGIAGLFECGIRRTTLLTILVCSTSLSAHWAFMFWYLQHLRNLSGKQGWAPQEVSHLVTMALVVVMVMSIVGNFLAGFVARHVGYRRTIVGGFLVYFVCMMGAYGVPREVAGLWPFLVLIGICQGTFALFTMYLPPLFPTLLRTTGAGFCYNIGRVAAAFGTVYFGLFSKVGDYRLALLYAGLVFVPAAAFAFFLPELADEPAHP